MAEIHAIKHRFQSALSDRVFCAGAVWRNLRFSGPPPERAGIEIDGPGGQVMAQD
jgi:hypothetical protein